MAEFGVDVDASSLKAMFKELPDYAQERVGRAVCTHASNQSAKRARQFVRKDTGTLASSIQTRTENRDGKFWRAVTSTGKKSGMFRGKTFYGGFWDLGFRRGRRTGPNTVQITKVPGDRFMRRSVYDYLDSMLSEMASLGKTLLERFRPSR